MIQLTHTELRFALTSKQRNFVLYYIQTNGNAPESAMMASNCSSPKPLLRARNHYRKKSLPYVYKRQCRVSLAALGNSPYTSGPYETVRAEARVQFLYRGSESPSLFEICLVGRS